MPRCACRSACRQGATAAEYNHSGRSCPRAIQTLLTTCSNVSVRKELLPGGARARRTRHARPVLVRPSQVREKSLGTAFSQFSLDGNNTDICSGNVAVERKRIQCDGATTPAGVHVPRLKFWKLTIVQDDLHGHGCAGLCRAVSNVWRGCGQRAGVIRRGAAQGEQSEQSEAVAGGAPALYTSNRLSARGHGRHGRGGGRRRAAGLRAGTPGGAGHRAAPRS